MTLLLDTHVFLWYLGADPRLPSVFRDAIRDRANQVHLSVASVWECVIKHGLGRLPLPKPPAEYLPQQRAAHQIASLPIDEGVLSYLASLPALHRDPFDRMLVAQALQHGLTILTMDDAVRAYSVPFLSPA
jgi:PIN domain nuclease of toxin-antitoxin system